MERGFELEAFRENLRRFLMVANKAGYASREEKNWIKEEDGSKTIKFQSGDFRLHDNFFGRERFGGREIVFFRGKAVWMMVYYGKVARGQNPDKIYPFLQKALSNIPPEMPVRGPLEMEGEELTYENGWTGNIEDFSGHEEIVNKEGQTVYRARYAGGLVDQKRVQ